MVYHRHGAATRMQLFRDHFLKGGFLTYSVEESLYRTTDGFTARFYVQDQFEDLFRTFFEDVSSTLCGQDTDAVPLPRLLRSAALKFIPEDVLRRRQAKQGSFIFLQAANPV
jgi:hypothetical protein